MQKKVGRQRRVPSLKRLLIDLYLDLEKVERRRTSSWHEQLSQFEIMVILLEDRRYLRHRGIDWQSVLRVILKSLQTRRTGGASTIEMQFVRTATNNYERTAGRKLREMILAFLLGFRMDKATILRSYLECAYFGHGIRGAHAAASTMFGKSPEALSLEEAAVVAAMMVYPKPTSVTEKWQRRVNRRARYGLTLYARFHDRFHELRMAQVL